MIEVDNASIDFGRRTRLKVAPDSSPAETAAPSHASERIGLTRTWVSVSWCVTVGHNVALALHRDPGCFSGENLLRRLDFWQSRLGISRTNRAIREIVTGGSNMKRSGFSVVRMPGQGDRCRSQLAFERASSCLSTHTILLYPSDTTFKPS